MFARVVAVCAVFVIGCCMVSTAKGEALKARRESETTKRTIRWSLPDPHHKDRTLRGEDAEDFLKHQSFKGTSNLKKPAFTELTGLTFKVIGEISHEDEFSIVLHVDDGTRRGRDFLVEADLSLNDDQEYEIKHFHQLI
jgi:hypothetical protein